MKKKKKKPESISTQIYIFEDKYGDGVWICKSDNKIGICTKDSDGITAYSLSMDEAKKLSDILKKETK